MTSPVSPSETIAKAMEGEFRRAAVNLVDTLVLERETNGQSKEFMDWAVFMAIRTFKEQLSALALQLEAMQRENAELRAERRMIVSHATMGGTDGEGMSVNAVSVEITRLRNHLIEDTRARTLIQGEKK